MKISRRKLDEWRSAGMVVNETTPQVVAAAPEKATDTTPVATGKRKWRFDIERDWDGYIKNVVAVEL